MYRLIIFDVDGTFYDLDDVVEVNYNMQVDFYARQKRLKDDEVRKIFAENRILPYKSEKAKSATEFFLQNGIDRKIWEVYRNSHSSPKSIRKQKAVPNNLLKKYANLTKLVLLSSNTEENIQNTLEWLKIDRTFFDAVFCASTELGTKLFSKAEMMKFILQKYGLMAWEVLSIGDRYDTDIAPLLSIGGDGILIHSPQALEEIYNSLVGGTLGTVKSDVYQFYKG